VLHNSLTAGLKQQKGTVGKQLENSICQKSAEVLTLKLCRLHEVAKLARPKPNPRADYFCGACGLKAKLRIMCCKCCCHDTLYYLYVEDWQQHNG